MPRRARPEIHRGKGIFVTETTSAARPSDGLSGKLLPELKAMAAKLGIAGTSGMRKGDLVAAIAAHQGASGSANGGRPRRGASRPAGEPAKNAQTQRGVAGQGRVF